MCSLLFVKVEEPMIARIECSDAPHRCLCAIECTSKPEVQLQQQQQSSNFVFIVVVVTMGCLETPSSSGEYCNANENYSTDGSVTSFRHTSTQWFSWSMMWQKGQSGILWQICRPVLCVARGKRSQALVERTMAVVDLSQIMIVSRLSSNEKKENYD